jgi:hydrogenase maturation factor
VFSLRDKILAQEIVSSIKRSDVDLKFMHVCGTHQDTLVKHGLDVLLEECGVEIGQGPGCPVCVTTPKEIEEMLLLAKKGVTVTTFGDMIRVPGEKYSLQHMKAEGSVFWPRNEKKLKEAFLRNMNPANYESPEAFKNAKDRIQRMPVTDFGKLLAAIMAEDEEVAA